MGSTNGLQHRVQVRGGGRLEQWLLLPTEKRLSCAPALSTMRGAISVPSHEKSPIMYVAM